MNRKQGFSPEVVRRPGVLSGRHERRVEGIVAGCSLHGAQLSGAADEVVLLMCMQEHSRLLLAQWYCCSCSTALAVGFCSRFEREARNLKEELCL